MDFLSLIVALCLIMLVTLSLTGNMVRSTNQRWQLQSGGAYDIPWYDTWEAAYDPTLWPRRTTGSVILPTRNAFNDMYYTET
jgi:hypothetical protein